MDRDQHRVFEKMKIILGDIYKPDKIESKVITESATRLQLFENGELDTAVVSGMNTINIKKTQE